MIDSLITALFSGDNVLILGGLIGLGYFLRALEDVPNRRISSIQTVFALHICLFKVPNPVDAICVGFILAGLAQILYSTILQNIEDIIRSRFGGGSNQPPPTMPRMLLFFFCVTMFCGCATIAPNTTALPPDATPEQRRAAQLADVRRALSDPANQLGAEIIISETGKFALSTVKDQIDRDAIKAQLKACGEAGEKLLSTGKPITAEQFKGIFSIASFTSKLDAEKFAKQFETALAPVNGYIVKVTQADDPKIMREWLALLSRCAISVGS